MSKATKKKHVAREVLEDLVIPSDKQQIVRVSFTDTIGIDKFYDRLLAAAETTYTKFSQPMEKISCAACPLSFDETFG